MNVDVNQDEHAAETDIAWLSYKHDIQHFIFYRALLSFNVLSLVSLTMI